MPSLADPQAVSGGCVAAWLCGCCPQPFVFVALGVAVLHGIPIAVLRMGLQLNKTSTSSQPDDHSRPTSISSQLPSRSGTWLGATATTLDDDDELSK